ncbi:MAG: hypothetical protein ACTHMM_19485 [Agriterribacter sp.]
MKKTFYQFIFTVTLCISVNCLQAQISKGASLLGGSIHFSSTINESYSYGFQVKESAFGISPSYGRFIKQNLALGVQLSYIANNFTNKNPTNPERKQHSDAYGVGVYLRQYKNLGSSGFYLFLQSNAGGQWFLKKTKYQSGYDYAETKGYKIGLNLTPGIAYAVTPRFHIETGLSNLLFVEYNNSKEISASGLSSFDEKYSRFMAGASVGENLEFTVGFRILLAK